LASAVNKTIPEEAVLQPPQGSGLILARLGAELDKNKSSFE